MAQLLLCQYNYEDIRKILNIVYLYKIFSVKTEVDLQQPLKQGCPNRAEFLLILKQRICNGTSGVVLDYFIVDNTFQRCEYFQTLT